MKIKKLLALSLSVVLAFTLIAVPASAAMPLNVTNYVEDFSDANLPKWQSNSNANLTTIKGFVSDGKLSVLDTNTIQIWLQLKDNAFDFANITDYTVSCDITLGTNDSATNKIRTAGIAARMTGASTGGYEYQLYCPKEATAGYVRLFDRSKAIATDNGILATNAEASFNIGELQHLSMSVKDNVVKCYLNGELVITYTDTTNTFATGYAGIRLPTASYKCVCDNFEVNHTEILDNYFYDDFSSYTQDTNTNKRIAMTNNGWYVNNNIISGVVNGGEISIPADFTLDHFGIQCNGAKGALAWNDYSVEADVTIGEGTLTNNVYAGVGGRYNAVVGVNPNGYEVQIYVKTDSTTGIRIYSRGGSAEIANKSMTIVQGQKYNVKAVFQGNRIDAYLDNELVLTTTCNDYTLGYAGIRYIGKQKVGTGVVTTIDNFVVYDYNVIPDPTPNKVENFDSYTPSYIEGTETYDKQYIQAAGWGSTTNGNLTNYVPYFADGKLTIPTTASTDLNLFLNTTKAKAWQNYSVSMDIRSDATSSGTYVFFGGRCSDYKTGYFVKIYMGSSGHIREIHLQDKYKGADLGTAYVPANAARPISTEYFTVKLEMNGTSIKVYLDDTVIIEATDSTYTQGSIAIDAGTSNNSTVDVDNVTVYDYDNPIQYKRTYVGDVNKDDKLDATDLSALIDAVLAGGEADVNADKATNILDIVRLKKIFASL